MKLAIGTAQSLADSGPAGAELLNQWLAMGKDEAPTGTAFPILPMVAILALGAKAAREKNETTFKDHLQTLRNHADDSRREVRDAVVAALVLSIQRRPEQTIEELATWSDGYLHSSLVLEAISDPTSTQLIRNPILPLSRIQEAFALAANAPRSHQRSQGYRALLRDLQLAISTLGARFPHVVAPWVEEQAAVATKDLLITLQESLDKLRASGMKKGDAISAYEALDAAVPPPRDPRDYVGPTRGRGKKNHLGKFSMG